MIPFVSQLAQTQRFLELLLDFRKGAARAITLEVG